MLKTVIYAAIVTFRNEWDTEYSQLSTAAEKNYKLQ